MRKIILGLWLFSAQVSFAQADSSVAFSRMENALREPGAFIRTEESTLGVLENNITLGLITATDLQRDIPKRKVLCFSVQSVFFKNDFSIDDTHIDEEDFPALINVLERMNAVIGVKTDKTLQTFSYTTSNLVVFHLRNRPGNTKRWDLIVYKRYIHINRPVPGSLYLITDDNVGTLLNYVKMARSSNN
ncbi:MAG: hypothetical protein SFU20_02545 [Chitinophagaceae bacterium]|nr:hypothetical protein [Chitinophagaceae bacterium]